MTKYNRVKDKDYGILPIGVLIALPVFFSMAIDGVFTLDRVGGVDNSAYYITLPISLSVALYMLLRYSWKILLSKYVLLLAVWLILCGTVKYIHSHSIDLSHIKVASEMLLFVLLTKVFEKYWSDKNLGYQELQKIEKKYIISPFIYIVCIVVLSNIILEKGSIFSDDIKIYNFEQYYALSLIPIMGIILNRPSTLISLAVIAMLIYITIYSANITCLVLMILCFVMWLFFRLINRKYYSLLYFLVLTTVIIFFLFIYPLILLATDSYGLLSSESASLAKRADMMSAYFNSLEYYHLLLPFYSDARSLETGMHNELLEVFNASGFIGVITYYIFIIKRLKSFHKKYYLVGLSIAILIFVGGTTVVPTLHLYTMLIVSYLISYYYVLSKKMKNINNIV